MIDMQTIFDMHRLKEAGFSKTEISKKMNLDRKTVRKYLHDPLKKAAKRVHPTSKLAPFHDYITEIYTNNPGIKATVIEQRIREKGFTGEITIIRLYLHHLKREKISHEPFIRFESKPGEQMQVDWGHFGTLDYNGCKRKLYALCVIESHSRMLYVMFTHSQKQDVLHQGLYNAFVFFGGCPVELVVDNMMTAVTERVGKIIRFNDAFLSFLLPFNIKPYACNVRAPHEKGKIESGIKYLRNNFIPARTFDGLDDINRQVQSWLTSVANVRRHQSTGKRPVDCLVKEAFIPLPPMTPDLRETGSYRVHKDFGVRFDGNVYTVPPWTIGKQVTVKADQKRVFIYYRERSIAVHTRSFEKHRRIENPDHTAMVRKIRHDHMMNRQTEAFLSLGKPACDFVEKLASNRQALAKAISSLLSLKDDYGRESLLYAMTKAMDQNLYGADYVENILYQEMTPQTNHPKVQLKNKELNDIRLTSPALEEYDALALKKRKKHHG